MKPTEKDIVIEKIMEMPAEKVAKVLIFIAGLEAGENINTKSEIKKSGSQKDNNTSEVTIWEKTI